MLFEKINIKYRPHKAFLYIAIVFGFLVMIITPPFQAQDECAHFYRAWQVSTGNFSSVNLNQRLGGYVPESLVDIYTGFRPYVLNKHNRITPEQLWKMRSIVLNPNDTVFVDFTNTALYSAFLYLPQAAGIFIGRLFGAGPFWLIYLGRLANLFFFIIIGYYVIKIVPLKKWLFVLLMCLPMSFTVHSSLSADVLVNSLSYLIIAIVLALSYNENIQKIGLKHILVILVLSVLIGLAKLVYVPILFLLFLIPAKKFVSTKVKIGIVAVAILAGVGTAFTQKSIIDSKYIPYSEYNETFRDFTALNKGCDINKQKDYILENPKHTIKIFVKSFFYEFKYMAQGYIGLVGWGHLYPPLWFVFMAYLIIFLKALFDLNNSALPNYTLMQKGYIGLIVMLITGLIMLSQYLSWDVVGEDRAYPLIGRYFIPVFPLFFIMLFNIIKVKLKYFTHDNLIHVIFVFCVFSGVLSLYLIAVNSYTFNEYSHVKWGMSYSFKENINDLGSNEYIISGKDTMAVFSKPKGDFVTDEKVFTGSRSLKMSNNNPYGFTLKIFKGFANDKLIASCRSYGYGGFLNFQEFPNGVNYWILKTYPQKDSLGWKYHEVQFILPHDIPKGKEFRVFIWWPYANSIYIDKFKVAYYGKD